MPDKKPKSGDIVKVLDSLKEDEASFTVDHLNCEFTEVVRKPDGTTETRHRRYTVKRNRVSVSLRAVILTAIVVSVLVLKPEFAGAVSRVLRAWLNSG